MGERSGILTLTSDFGTADGFVGAMKGVALALFPAVRLVDVTHEIAPFDLVGAALALRAAARHFPPGTVHLAVVDPGVGGERAPVALEAWGQLFVGPNNGLFALVVPPLARAHRIEATPFVAERPAPTFHGRDLFARTGALLAAGAEIAEVGPRHELLAPLAWPRPRWLGDGAIAGEIVHVDRFGNLVTNLEEEHARCASILRIGERALPICRTFSDVDRGLPLAYVGSSGLVELAVREGRADELFGATRGQAVVLRQGTS